MSRPTVLLADDHRIVAEGVKALLAPEFDLVGVVEDGRSLVEEAARLRPDIVVADISMPLLNGIDALVQMRKNDPEVKVVLLTMHREVAYARRALEAGAAGVVLKHSAADTLLMAIRASLDGQVFVAPELAAEVLESMRSDPHLANDPSSRLTPRQREVLQLLVEGKSAKEIAAILGVSSRTVEFHKYEMMNTLGLRSGAELVRFAVKTGIAPL